MRAETTTDVGNAAEELDDFLSGLKQRHRLSAEQLYDLMSWKRSECFRRIDQGITINHTEMGKLVEVVKAMLGVQEGLSCWNKEYAHRLLEVLQGKGVSDARIPK